MTQNFEKLVYAVPVVGFLAYMLKYFMKVYEKEKEINKVRDKQDYKIMEGLKYHIEESNKIQSESNKKHDETNIKIDSIIRKLDR